MSKKIVVTSALPYANGSIHIGHLVEYIQTDIFVRFLKLIGEDAIYCCADDTHGTPIQMHAEKLGIKPEELIAKFHKEHQEDFSMYGIEFDSYYSTNSDENKHYAELIFKRLNEAGLIYKKTIKQVYCESCKRYLPDRYVKGTCPKCDAEDQYGDVCEKCSTVLKAADLKNPYCSVCKAKPVEKESEHYFFKLSACSDDIEKWLQGNKNLQPEMVNYIQNWIKEGLEDWDITRDGPYFGFNIPGEADKYFYVWLDAPIGYISSTANYCKDKDCKVEDYWNSENGEIIHFIGKDIIYFHFLFWPAMLMKAGFNLPKDIVVHGFLTVNGEKMSKSRGTFLTAKEFSEMYSPELLRFYYASMLSKKMSDVDLNFKEFADKVNNEFVANIGNFCYRSLSFTNKQLDSSITELDENDVMKEVLNRVDKVKEAYQKVNLKEAMKLIMEISAAGNKYMQDKEPWKTAKDDLEGTRKVLGTCVNISKIIVILLDPIMPKYCAEIKKQLNLEGVNIGDINFDTKHHKIGKAEILVKKVEERENEPVFPLNLKVAEILEASEVENSEKLIQMKIKCDRERSLVAGIKQWYKADDLIGKKIIIVSNLKPAKLAGILSEGMLLTGKDGEKLELLTVEGNCGDEVTAEGFLNNQDQIKIDDFGKVKLKIKDKKVLFDNKVLKVDGKEVFVDVKDGAKVS